MSTSASLEHSFRYPHASYLDVAGQWPDLRLATSGGASDEDITSPFFFRGRLRHPRRVADMLLALLQVVTTRFHLPGSVLAALDPVVTSSERVLRFEGFSACCGVYARVDLGAEDLDADIMGRGTTNVDFNTRMRSALNRIRSCEHVGLAVGDDEVRLQRRDLGDVVEKKVVLPVRWIKGFSEVQVHQAGLRHRFDVDATTARAFLRSLPRSGSPKRESWIVRQQRGLRLSQRASAGSVRIAGFDRLRLIEPLVDEPNVTVSVFSNDDTGVCAWSAHLGESRMTLVLSPEIWRGFSGEGRLLTALADRRGAEVVRRVQSHLCWQSSIDVSSLAEELDVAVEQVDGALARLGARGLVGYDLISQSYYHRRLPFDIDAIEKLQPRLLQARKLVGTGAVRIVSSTKSRSGQVCEAFVQGTGVEHRVRLLDDGDRCTCPWFSKHRGERGPCKHILAARLVLDAAPESEE